MSINNITPGVNGSINRSVSLFGSKASTENLRELRKRDCSKRKRKRKRKQKGREWKGKKKVRTK